jgi:glycosyl transferase family 25
MKAYVINLPRSAARRESIASELAALSIPHEFVEAVDGREMTTDDRTALVDEDAVAKYPNWLTPGQIGCSLSHRRVYERIAAGDEPVALVLEDDAQVDGVDMALIERIASHMGGAEVVLLFFLSFAPCVFSSQDTIELGPGRRLLYPLDVRQPISSAAYLITHEASRRMAELVVPVRAGADSWGFYHEEGGIDRLRCVVPSPAAVNNELKSTIDYSEQHSLRVRFTTAVARRHLFPFHQLFTLNRRLLRWRMTRYREVPDRSPQADNRSV